MKIKVFDTYKKAMAVAIASWGTTAVIVLARAAEVVPQRLGTVAILTLGFGIASSVSISRFRLTSAITQVFHVGLTSAITMSANVFTDTAIMQLNSNGYIDDVDHADAIGWEESELTGKCLADLLTPRSHEGSIRHIEPGTTITSPMLNGKGGKFDARITVAALGAKEHTGDEGDQRRLIVTIAPVVNPNIPT